MSRESFKAKVIAEAEADMVAWGDRPIVVELDLAGAVQVCAALQLALRHPGYKDTAAAKQARGFVQAIEQQIPAEFPGLKKIISLGFHPRFDA